MHHEKLVDESGECIAQGTSFIASQKYRNSFLHRVLIRIFSDPAHDRFALHVERQQPAIAVCIYIEVLKLFRNLERGDWNAKRVREFSQAHRICHESQLITARGRICAHALRLSLAPRTDATESDGRFSFSRLHSLTSPGCQSMPYDTKRYWLGFLPDALIASQVGIWETDFANDRTVADSITAALFGLDPVQAAIGLPLAAYTKAILPADQDEFFANIDRVCEHGGLFVVEYRVRSAERGVRWVLARGHYKRNPQTGKVLGRGIVVDITEGKLNGQLEDRALFVLPNKNEAPLDQIATYALQARRAVDDVAGHEEPALRSAIDGLLWAVGRALAKRSRF